MMLDFLETGKALYVLAAVCALGLLSRLTARNRYKRLIRETDNMTLTKNRYLRELKQKAENAYRLNQGIQNTQAYLEKQLTGYRFLGLSLSGWGNLSSQLTVLCFLSGGAAAFASYWYRCDNYYIVLYGTVGILTGLLTLFVDCGVNLSERKNQLLNALQDYMENSLFHRLSRETASAMEEGAREGSRGGYRESGISGMRESGARETATREGGYRENGNREGGYRENGNREGGYRENGSRESGYRENGNREGSYRENGNRESTTRENVNRERESGTRESVNRERGNRDNNVRELTIHDLNIKDLNAREDGTLDGITRDGIRSISQRERSKLDRSRNGGTDGIVGGEEENLDRSSKKSGRLVRKAQKEEPASSLMQDKNMSRKDMDYLKRSLEQIAATREKNPGDGDWIKDLSSDELELVGEILKQYLS